MSIHPLVSERDSSWRHRFESPAAWSGAACRPGSFATSHEPSSIRKVLHQLRRVGGRAPGPTLEQTRAPCRSELRIRRGISCLTGIGSLAAAVPASSAQPKQRHFTERDRHRGWLVRHCELCVRLGQGQLSASRDHPAVSSRRTTTRRWAGWHEPFAFCSRKGQNSISLTFRR